MKVLTASSGAKVQRRLVPFIVFFSSGLLLFESQFFAFNGGGRRFQIVTFVGLPLLFLGVTAWLKQHQHLIAYVPAFYSYLIASVALLFMWLLDDFPVRWVGLDPKRPQGMAVGKISDAVVLIVTVVILSRLFRFDLGSMYLQKGRIGLGIAIGVAGFVGMAVFALLEARSMGIGMDRILGWSPWLLTFVLTNGFFEELMARGLFLRKFEPLLGPRLANLVTALVFAIGHAGVTYTTDILAFLIITFTFGLVWAYVMQKTGALWASALFHAGADTLIMIGIFAGVKT